MIICCGMAVKEDGNVWSGYEEGEGTDCEGG